MTVLGHVRNGVVVLDEPCTLPDGSNVNVRLLGERAADVTGQEADLTAEQKDELDRRLAEHQDNPKAGSSWDGVKARLRDTR